MKILQVLCYSTRQSLHHTYTINTYEIYTKSFFGHSQTTLTTNFCTCSNFTSQNRTPANNDHCSDFALTPQNCQVLTLVQWLTVTPYQPGG